MKLEHTFQSKGQQETTNYPLVCYQDKPFACEPGFSFESRMEECKLDDFLYADSHQPQKVKSSCYVQSSCYVKTSCYVKSSCYVQRTQHREEKTETTLQTRQEGSLMRDYPVLKGIRLDMSIGTLLTDLGYAYFKKDRQDLEHINEGIKNFEKALAMLPKEELPELHAMALNNLGIAKMIKFHYDKNVELEKTVKLFEKALEIYSSNNLVYNHTAVYYNLGCCLAKLGKKEEAVEIFDKILDLSEINNLKLLSEMVRCQRVNLKPVEKQTSQIA